MSKTTTVSLIEETENTNNEPERIRVVNNNLIMYYSMEELAQLGEMSERQLHRVKNKIPRDEFDRFIMTMGNRTFYSPALLFLTKSYKKQIKNLDYARMLAAHGWNYTFTIGFKNDYNSDCCRRNIEGFISHLKKQFYESPLTSRQMVLFYSLEKYAGREGYHIHGAMGFLSNESKNLGKQIFEEYYPARQIDRLIEEHDNANYWLEYIVKHIGSNKDSYDYAFIR